jgi:hypothetical protein
MSFVECGNGHIYDAGMYQACPYCNGGMKRMEFGQGGASNIGKTVPVGGGAANPAPYGLSPSPEIGATVAPSGYRKSLEEDKKKAESDDTGKTVGVFQKTMKIEPVVGWLVCIDGPDKGKDFRILAKNNTIGRNEKMDICIKGDTTISRENHARLGYDDKHNAYHLIPGESSNNIYIEDEPVYVPTKLEAYQVIEFGETKLVFVPFCGEKFTWKDGLK